MTSKYDKDIKYHGTGEAFDKIDLFRSGTEKDFGSGFYLAENYKSAHDMAYKRAKRRGIGYVYGYRVTKDLLEGLNVHTFNGTSIAWFDFIVNNRYNPDFKHDFDVVIGPIADAKTMDLLDEYIRLEEEKRNNVMVKRLYMLFENDKAEESLKWAIGEENRQINPVVYQTLQHKVYVSAVSSGTSVATDSRAITNAQKLGEGNKQVIYKGSAIGNAFTLHQDNSKKSAALLTVKTYEVLRLFAFGHIL